MIIRMFAAMFSFVAFLLVILLGYGVASHTIMHPAQEFQQKAILEVIYGWDITFTAKFILYYLTIIIIDRTFQYLVA